MEQAEGLEALARLAPFLRLFGKPRRDAASALQKSRGLVAQAREMTSLPVRFNAVLGVLPTLVIGALGTLLATGWLVLSPVLFWRE